MTYKDCIHNEVCIFRGKDYCPEDCAQFKDKDRFVEIPCEFGDVVYCVIRNPYEKGFMVLLTREEAEQALRERKDNDQD